jgi:hypothetical protein
MSSVATTPRRMETFARALDRAVASAVVPRSRIDQLRSAFIATDAQGRSWTIDPEFQRWGRLDGERWMVDDPPPQLFMDSELRASLEALEAMAARAIVKGADALHAPRTPWFLTAVAPAELPRVPASSPSRESATAPQPPLDRPATEDPVVEPVRMQAATPVEKTASSRSTIPEAHRRFAGPVIAPAPDDSATPASVPPRDASHERWVPTSIAPRLMAEHPEARDDRAHVFLCGLIAALFLALAFLKGDDRGYGAALLFGLLTVTLLVLNLAKNHHD